MIWLKHGFHVDLGFLPSLLSEDDPRGVKEQLDDKYRHGGGWRPMDGWTLEPKTFALKYPNDPPMRPLASAQLRHEQIFFYQYSFLCVVQPDGSFEVARVD